MSLSNRLAKHAVLIIVSALSVVACSSSSGQVLGNRGDRGPPQTGQRDSPQRGTPSGAMLAACEGKSSGDICTADGDSGSCSAPRSDLPLACVPQRGQGGPSRRQGPGGQNDGPPGGRAAQSNTGSPVPGTQAYTLGVLCGYSVDSFNPQLSLPSQVSWTCERGQRLLSANSIPMHPTGEFPNSGNPSRISPQTVSFAVTTTPQALSGPGARVKEPAMALNGIKFDPGTAGRCSDTISDPSQCDLGRGDGQWSIEALGQDVFDFGEDENNAHVQPSGHYHYHGVPEGMLSEATRRGDSMQLIGWAADGFPIYARYGYVSPLSPLAGLTAMTSSYQLKQTPDAGRPPVELVPMGTFTNDWEYVEGSGDLDECNGRFASAPEFPEGIYQYYATDTFPYVQRCVKGSVESSPRAEQRGGGREGQRRRRGRGGDGDRPPPRGGGRQ